MQIFALISVILISTPLASIFATPVLAQTFRPKVEYILADSTPGANSDITLVINQETAGEPGLKKITVTIPAGFDFTASDQLFQDEKVGQGTFVAGLQPDGSATYNTNVFLLNDQTLFSDQKAHWKLVFDDGSISPIDIFLTGDSATGHTFTIEFPISLPTPIFWPLNIFGISLLTSTPIVRNPINPTVFTWKTEFTSNTNLTATYLFGNGTLAPGNNVPITFATSEESIAIVFSQIASESTMAMTATSYEPVQGGGQFKVQDGLYYDLNTSFNTTQACTCNITLSYNPATNPNPKVYHLEDGVWIDVTTGVDTTNNRVSGTVSSLSYFAPGKPEFGLEFLDPIKALLSISDPMQLERNRTLPVNFTLTDSNGNFVSRSDVSVQVINTANNLLVGNAISAVALKNHYKTNLDLKSLNLGAGTYKLRVKVGNTIYSSYTSTSSPMPQFNPI